MTTKEKRLAAGVPTVHNNRIHKIYIAAQFESRHRIRPFAHQLWDLGYEIVGTWLNETAKPAGMSHEIFMKKLAWKDVAEIQSADLLIQDTFKMSPRGGASTEYGVALHAFQSKQLWVVGPLRSVFHYVCDKHFDTWLKAVEELRNPKKIS
jgi:hypothetical protein